ncbi:MAG: PIG-L family deacetylase [Methylococcales bacterium]|nr:PIG-L family deacetylase [Methylococcales bacterium]
MKPRALSILPILLLSLATAQAQPIQNLEIGQGERLLVLAPHPDDETLSAAGVIQQVYQRGGTVREVVVTAGDAYVGAIVEATGKANPAPSDYLDYGEQRLEESRKAAQLLGKGFSHLDLLGFSDGSIYAMLVRHWRRAYPDKSEYTRISRVPYREAEDKGVAQDGQDLRNELVAIMRDTKPTLIIFPDVMENDSDHAALGMFALLAVSVWLETGKSPQPAPRLLAYLIHWQHGWPPGSGADKPQDHSGQPLYLPDDLPLRGHQRTCLNLTEQEIDAKRQALALYKTQQRAMAPFLAAFIHSNECFTELKPADAVGIDNVVKQWRHIRKAFDSHPLTRKKIILSKD